MSVANTLLKREVVDMYNHCDANDKCEIWIPSRAFGFPVSQEVEAECQRVLGADWEVSPDQQGARVGFAFCRRKPILTRGKEVLQG